MLTSLVLTRSSDTADAVGAGLSLILLFVIGLVSLALLAFHIYVLVDMLRYSDAVWLATGQNKTTCVVLWVVSTCCSFSLILDLIYWFVPRPKLKAAESGGYPGPGPGYPGGYPG